MVHLKMVNISNFMIHILPPFKNKTYLKKYIGVSVGSSVKTNVALVGNVDNRRYCACVGGTWETYIFSVFL